MSTNPFNALVAQEAGFFLDDDELLLINIALIGMHLKLFQFEESTILDLSDKVHAEYTRRIREKDGRG